MSPKEIRALIVDDEPAALSLLGKMLRAESGVRVVGECGDGEEAVHWLEENEADLVFLDIRMPRLDGLQVIQHTSPDDLPPVVFVTAYDEFAVRAFEVQAWDYLLKPFDAERLRETLARVRRRLDEKAELPLPERLSGLLRNFATQSAPVERLAVRKGRARVTIRVEDIRWIEAESNYVRLHLAETSYLERTSLTALERTLDPRRFVRIHRSLIVNADRIRRIESAGHGDMLLTLEDGSHLNLSRRYRARLESVLETLS